ncbi:hypothetical protein [Phormidium sp. CCY1219]|uniref:hypothetical protein n=1 Tax=Phormidium sp. CCY1219 TaxID=2886104 RepID=UPI002D1EA082|nr:hypothetical protein [Phormidium sp. CCY1219]MEB3830214.1 hypothetical protein [Phormidium sp. CCY1219]
MVEDIGCVNPATRSRISTNGGGDAPLLIKPHKKRGIEIAEAKAMSAYADLIYKALGANNGLYVRQNIEYK